MGHEGVILATNSGCTPFSFARVHVFSRGKKGILSFTTVKATVTPVIYTN